MGEHDGLVQGDEMLQGHDGIEADWNALRKGAFWADRQGAGISMLEAQYALTKTNGLPLLKRIRGAEALVGRFEAHDDGTYTFVEPTTEMGEAIAEALHLAHEIYGYRQNIFYYDAPFFKNAIVELEKVLGREATLKERKDLWRGAASYIYSHPYLGFGDVVQERQRLLLGDDSLAHRIKKAKEKPHNKNNFLLNRLEPRFSEEPGGFHLVTYLASRGSRLDDAHALIEMKALLTHPDEEMRQLGEDLVAYHFITGGARGPFSFGKFIPTGYLETLPFSSVLRDLSFEDDTAGPLSRDFVHQYVQHHPDLAPAFTLEDLPAHLRRTERVMKQKLPPEQFTLKKGEDLPGLVPALVSAQEGKKKTAPPYLSHRTGDRGFVLFRRVYSTKTEAHYEQVSVLGTPYVSEYTYGRAGRSLIEANRTGVRTRPRVVPSTAETRSASSPVKRTNPVAAPIMAFVQGATPQARFKAAMARIIQRGDPAQKELAKLLRAAADLLPEGYDLVVETNYPGHGSYNPDGTVHVADDLSEKQAIRVLLHEHVHALTVPLIHRWQRDPSSVHPKLAAVLRSLDQLREQMRALEDPAVLQDFERRYYEWSNGGQPRQGTSQMTQEELLELYPLLNLQEFLTGALTSTSFQQKMTRIETGGRPSFLARLKRILTSLLRAIGEVVGHRVDGTLLEEAVSKTLILIQSGQQIPFGSRRINPSKGWEQDEFVYYGARYTILLQPDAQGRLAPVDAIHAEGPHQGKPHADESRLQALLEAYRRDPDVDPQTGEAFRKPAGGPPKRSPEPNPRRDMGKDLFKKANETVRRTRPLGRYEIDPDFPDPLAPLFDQDHTPQQGEPDLDDVEEGPARRLSRGGPHRGQPSKPQGPRPPDHDEFSGIDFGDMPRPMEASETALDGTLVQFMRELPQVERDRLREMIQAGQVKIVCK